MTTITFQFQGHGQRINWTNGPTKGTVQSMSQLKWQLLKRFGHPIHFKEQNGELSFIVE